MNHWVVAIRATWPYLLSAGIGFSAAWWLQGLNVTAAENDRDKITNQFTAYRVEQQRLTNEAITKADQQRQETADAWAKNLEQILKDKGAYERCVAAGRCGPVQRVCVALPVSRPAAAGVAEPISPPRQPDGAGAGTIPAPAGTATSADESAVAGLIADCKQAIGMANGLQADIESQPGYRKTK
jgi:hypothetical protein